MTRFAALILLVALLAMGMDLTPATAQVKGEKAQPQTLVERLPPKINKIQEELPAWLQKTGNKEAAGLMQKLGEQIKAKQFEEAEMTADSLLKMLGMNAPNAGANAGPTGDKALKKPSSISPEETTKRLTEKVERVMAGAQKWAASGRDPAEIAKTMQEKFQPLMQAGKIVEAEAVVDGVLKQLGVDASPPSAVPANEPSAEERVLARVHMIQKELPAWVKKTGRKADSDTLMQKLKEQLADMNFAEAEKTADTILEVMGLSIAPAAQTANDPKHASDPFAAFFPQQLVFLASERIALTPKQRDALLARVNTTQPRLEELKTAIERESTAITALMAQERLDEAAVLAQLNKLLDLERETKQLQVGLGVTIQNLLTSEQRAKLRELIRNPDAVAKLEGEFKNRITAKIERVTAGAQTWAQRGRDPSSIAQAMEQKVRPLMDSGRAFEAETEIDRVLEKLNEDTK
jgi:Spy/CpxP family protein refolding chaperone